MSKDTKKEEILQEYKEKFLPESVIPNDPEKKKEAEVIYAILCKSHIDWLSKTLTTYGDKREAEGREKAVDYIEDNYIPGGGGNEMLNFVNTLKSARLLNKDE